MISIMTHAHRSWAVQRLTLRQGGAGLTLDLQQGPHQDSEQCTGSFPACTSQITADDLQMLQARAAHALNQLYRGAASTLPEVGAHASIKVRHAPMLCCSARLSMDGIGKGNRQDED